MTNKDGEPAKEMISPKELKKAKEKKGKNGKHTS